MGASYVDDNLAIETIARYVGRLPCTRKLGLANKCANYIAVPVFYTP